MTYVEKALERVNKIIEQSEENSDEQIDYIVIKQACEKQIAKNIIRSDNYKVSGNCPICNKAFWSMDFIEPEYCDRCGQRLNWSEVNIG